jgi:hypothetical protein
MVLLCVALLATYCPPFYAAVYLPQHVCLRSDASCCWLDVLPLPGTAAVQGAVTASSGPIGLTTAGSGGLTAATQHSQLYSHANLPDGSLQHGTQHIHGQAHMQATPQPGAPPPPTDTPVFTSATPPTSMEFIPRTMPRLAHSDTVAATPGTAGGIAVCGNMSMKGCGQQRPFFLVSPRKTACPPLHATALDASAVVYSRTFDTHADMRQSIGPTSCCLRATAPSSESRRVGMQTVKSGDTGR